MPRPVMQGSSHFSECKIKHLEYLEACTALQAVSPDAIGSAIKAYNHVITTFEAFHSCVTSLPSTEQKIKTRYEKKFSSITKEQELFQQKFPYLFDPNFEQLRILYSEYKKAAQTLLNTSTLRQAASTRTTKKILTNVSAYTATLSAYAKVEKIYRDMEELLKKINSPTCTKIFETKHIQIKARSINKKTTLSNLFEMKHFLTEIALLKIHSDQILCNQIAHTSRSISFDPTKEATTFLSYSEGNSQCKQSIIEVLHQEIKDSLKFEKQLKTTFKHIQKLKSSFQEAAPYLADAEHMSKFLDQALLGAVASLGSIETVTDTSYLILTLNPCQEVPIEIPTLSPPTVWSPEEYGSTPFVKELTSLYPVYRIASKGPQSMYTAFIYAYLSDTQSIRHLKNILEHWNSPITASQKPVLDLIRQLEANPDQLDTLFQDKKNIHCLIHYFRSLAEHEIRMQPMKYDDYIQNRTKRGRTRYLEKIKHMRNSANTEDLKALSNKLSFSFCLANLDDQTKQSFINDSRKPIDTCFALKNGQALILLPSL